MSSKMQKSITQFAIQSPPTSARSRGWQCLSITALLAACLLIASPLATAAGVVEDADFEIRQAETTPVTMDWADDIKKFLEEVIKNSEKAKNSSSNQTAMLNDVVPATLSADLDEILFFIGEALTSPPPGEVGLDNAGVIDVSVDPQTLTEYADQCVMMANQALDEYVTGINFDRDYVATKLRTIRHLIVRSEPHNYRTISGISQ